MKKAKISDQEKDELQPEYSLDYSKARRNPFAGKIADDRIVVLLDADVSKVFTTPESVNTALRSLIAAMPVVKKRSKISQEV